MSGVLIADDAPFVREILRHILEKNGIEVIGEASDGEEAIRLAAQLSPAVILMDLVMPLRSGVEATKEILQTSPETRIIACSSLMHEGIISQAIEAGCCDF